MPTPLPPFGWHALATNWSFHLWWVLAGVVLLAVYLWAVVEAHRRGHRVHPARIGCWVFGVLLLEATLASAIDAYAMAAFWVHMIEHLILIMCVPAFLVLGHPLGVLAEALPETGRRRWLAALRSWPVSVLVHPVIGLAVYSIVIVYTHLTDFMDDMSRHSWLMPTEQVVYVLAGCLLLISLIGDEPIRWRLPYLFRIGMLLVAMTPDTVVGIVLMQSDTNPFPIYMGMRPDWASSAISDLQTGGALMWVGGDGLMMCYGIGVMVAMISSAGRREQVLGPWLESVRRNTLAEHVAESGAEPQDAEDLDPDSEESLAAYNRMLERLNRQGG